MVLKILSPMNSGPTERLRTDIGEKRGGFHPSPLREKARPLDYARGWRDEGGCWKAKCPSEN